MEMKACCCKETELGSFDVNRRDPRRKALACSMDKGRELRRLCGDGKGRVEKGRKGEKGRQL